MEAPSRSIVPEAAPAPPVPKARAAAAVKRKPKTEEPLEVGAAETAQLAEIAPVAKKLAPEGERKAGAAGTVSGAPQTLGQLTPGRQQGYGRLVPAAPAPAAAPSAPQAQAAASLGALAPVSPLQWSLLRRQSGGEFVAADAGDLQAGDAVRLRLESKDAGYVYVVEKEAVLASSRVEAGKPFDAAIESHGPGRRDLALWFSPYPMAWPTTGQAQMGAFRASAGAQSGNGVRAEDAVRAPAGSGGAASARPVAIAITLNYQ
jgi:hypothetical protein